MTEPNLLNMRVGLTKRSTVKTADRFDTVEVRLDSDKPEGLDALQALHQLSETADAFLSNKNSTAPATEQVQKDNAPPISKAELEAISFKQMPSKPDGFWAFTDKPESRKLVSLCLASPDRSMVIDGFRYTVSKDGKFLNRWPHKKDKA